MKSLAVRPSVLLATSSLCLLFLVRPALAQNKAIEGQARGLQRKAMQEDYLATDFEKAQDKLTTAITKCGTEKCSIVLRAELRRDLGVVQIGGQLDKEKGIANWVEALKLDPGLQLDPDVKTKELEKIWEDAMKSSSGAGGGKGATAEVPPGDFTHTPVAEQLVRTPVPVYAEYSGSDQVVKVVVKYKGFGMPDWKAVELKRVDKGYGGLLPCHDVQQGEVLYYLQGFNAQSDPVATSGDRNNPFRVPVRREALEGEAPHLPGQAAPAQCNDPGASDCPPDFPGCKKVVAPVGADKSAEEDTSRKSDGDDCEEDSDCRSNQCKKGKCAATQKKFSRFWVGATAGIDLVFLGSASNVCTLDGTKATPVNDAGYYCTDGGADYPSRTDNGAQNKQIQPGLNTIAGGAAPGNVRVMLSVDYAVTTNILVGGRFGYVFNSYSGQAAKDEGKAFAPIHLEARGTYVIGKDAIAKPGLAPYAFVSLGVSAFDATIDVNVIDNGVPKNKRTVQAWAIGGPAFAAVGGGLRYAVGTRAALMIAPKFVFAFGANPMLPVFSPELGFQVGF